MSGAVVGGLGNGYVLEDRFKVVGMREIGSVKGKRRIGLQFCQAVLFQPQIVVIVEVVHPADTVAFIEEPFGKVKADEASGTSDEGCIEFKEHCLYFPYRQN